GELHGGSKRGRTPRGLSPECRRRCVAHLAAESERWLGRLDAAEQSGCGQRTGVRTSRGWQAQARARGRYGRWPGVAWIADGPECRLVGLAAVGCSPWRQHPDVGVGSERKRDSRNLRGHRERRYLARLAKLAKR